LRRLGYCFSESRASGSAQSSEQGGISSDRISERGYGETKPVAPNTKPDGSDDPAGRRKNRRVVVGVVRR
jgi:outer membrane protein OmpA-like peptidoglycan-associated protein